MLLENGGSGVTRGAAAQQLGEVVRLHPQELLPLLNRLHGFLVHKSWDVRIAAGLAVEAIISNMPPWDPTPVLSPGTHSYVAQNIHCQKITCLRNKVFWETTKLGINKNIRLNKASIRFCFSLHLENK